MKIRKVILMLLSALVCGNVVAQTSGNNSPYSRYGLGTLADGAQSFNKGMGGVALGIRDKTTLNNSNPASYSAIDSLTLLFDIGASFTTAHISYGSTSVNPQNTTLDYISAGFRLWDNVGFSVGLRPYTTIGYNFASSEVMEDIDGYGEKTQTSTYLGEGGTHLVYGGLGWEPFKNFSIGANVGFLWGNYSHSSTIAFSESTIQSLRRYYQANVNTWTLDLGLQYALKLNKNNTVNVGVTAGVGHGINERATFINQKYNSSSTIGVDTIKVSNAFELPWSYGAGVAWDYKGRLIVAFDYTTQLWKDCRFPELSTSNGTEVYEVGTTSFLNRQKFALGAQYMANPDGLNYKDHIIYRAGITYATPYYKMSNQDGPKNYTASVGVAFPIMNSYSNRSIVSISGEYERVAPSIKNQITENYFRLCVGLTFNARWFNKWKFE